MMRRLAIAAQAFALLVGVAVGTHQSLLPLVVAALVGAALLVPLAARACDRIARALASLWHGPTGIWRTPDVPDFVVPPAPGTPGTTLARAPSGGVHALA